MMKTVKVKVELFIKSEIELPSYEELDGPKCNDKNDLKE